MDFIKAYFKNKIGYQSLALNEQHTFKLHLGFMLTDGFVQGVLLLNEFVFLRSLKGSSFQLSFLFQFSVIAFIFLILISEWMKRVNDKQKLVRITGLFTRMPLALILLFPRDPAIYSADSVYHYIYLVLFLVYYMGNLVIFPMINLFLKSNYRHELFGPLFSYTTLANKIVMLIVAFVYGWVLDFDASAYRWIIALAAVSGTLSTYFLSRINYAENEAGTTVANGIWQSVLTSVRNLRNILKDNLPFRHFEWGFMFYGFAFMSTTTVITIFFEKELALNYFSVATYKNLYNIVALFLIPYFGRTLSRIDPRHFAAVTFLSIMLFLLSLVLTDYFPAYVYIKGFKLFYGMIPFILFQAVFAATMSLLWSIGSAYFCKPSEAGDYQSVHLFLTSARSLLAPLLGVLFYELYGFVFTFLTGVGFLVIAIGIMLWSYKREGKLSVKSD
ncbi:MAG TPA: MFS transporter [Lentimicrobium sp.]|nr:MFS transporter [Lentimicrobium sp.]